MQLRSVRYQSNLCTVPIKSMGLLLSMCGNVGQQFGAIRPDVAAEAAKRTEDRGFFCGVLLRHSAIIHFVVGSANNSTALQHNALRRQEIK